MADFDFLSAGKKATHRLSAKGIQGLVLLAIAAILVTVVYSSLTTYLRPYEVGIKVSRYGGGLDPQPYYGPGLFLTGPGVTIHRFPIVIQSLTMHSGDAESARQSPHSRTIRALEIDSLDGSKIAIEATILYRIVDPYKVMTAIGPGRMFEDNALIPKSSEALKSKLGRLRAEDFYSESKRILATEEARKALNATLKDMGLAVDYVLIRQYSYLPEYQQQIETRKVQDQLVFTNQAMAEAARTEATLRKIQAEGQAMVDVESKRGSSEVTKIKAESDLYNRKRRAEGDLMVSLAEARGRELENAAYRASAGAENLVGLEMANSLDGVEVIFLQSGKGGVNPLDVNQTLNMFDVRER